MNYYRHSIELYFYVSWLINSVGRCFSHGIEFQQRDRSRKAHIEGTCGFWKFGSHVFIALLAIIVLLVFVVYICASLHFRPMFKNHNVLNSTIA